MSTSVFRRELLSTAKVAGAASVVRGLFEAIYFLLRMRKKRSENESIVGGVGEAEKKRKVT
tara:strand:- start:2158 stop:2340 length:183 start_codon:yes stop_codon:yes gene_type:complete